ncbi:hypothetical protein [Streptomyces sp. Tu 2975]|uniref:hypothetical protein n=1 Tax=Streptomyces sp. Tu 2975 TaxID=2676871 RepID=UPI001FC9D8D4|nr:hypothetical protein [Streptomyces sp. Tu 2975]
MLPFGGLHGGLGQSVGADGMAAAQPGLQPLGADSADGGWGLVAGQQGERAGVGQIRRPFQARENAGELGSETVDGAGAVGGQVHAPAGEDLEVGDGVVAGV